jgi:hypothetical protein
VDEDEDGNVSAAAEMSLFVIVSHVDHVVTFWNNLFVHYYNILPNRSTQRFVFSTPLIFAEIQF